MKETNKETSMIFSLLENNMGWVVVLLLGTLAIIVFYRPIKRLIDRTKSITFGEEGFRFEGGAEPSSTSYEDRVAPKDIETSEAQEINQPQSENTWLTPSLEAFREGNVNKAKEIFSKYSQQQNDIESTYKEKAFFLYLQLTEGKDRDSINQLELHAKKADTEELKADTLTWLSDILIYDKQPERAIEIWKHFINNLSDSKLKTGAYLELSEAYLASNLPDIAKSILLKILDLNTTDLQRARCYTLLAKAEEKLNNKEISACCLDKAAQYQTDELSKLFDAAHQAADANIHELAIVNYHLLTSRQPDNASAWNNLGVVEKQIGLKIKSIQSYASSANLGETLAIANQGYELLDAGFVDLAEKLANEALAMNNTHPNIHSLLSAIETRKKSEKEKLDEILKNATKIQSRFRTFIEQYYLGGLDDIKGDWITQDSKEVSINPDNGKIQLKWETHKDNSESEVTARFRLIGDIQGSTFKGFYSKTHPSINFHLLNPPKDINIPCVGYIENNELHIYSTSMKDQTTITFKRKAS